MEVIISHIIPRQSQRCSITGCTQIPLRFLHLSRPFSHFSQQISFLSRSRWLSISFEQMRIYTSIILNDNQVKDACAPLLHTPLKQVFCIFDPLFSFETPRLISVYLMCLLLGDTQKGACLSKL